MNIQEKILEHGVGCFDELVESFSNEEIDEINQEYRMEDFACEFDFKFAVLRDHIKAWLIMDIECNEKIRYIRELFEIYASIA